MDDLNKDLDNAFNKLLYLKENFINVDKNTLEKFLYDVEALLDIGISLKNDLI